MYEYDLFAVINHEGKMNNGHYTNFARFQDEVCHHCQRRLTVFDL
jgi:ubiquitin C-terminal hydrolase